MLLLPPLRRTIFTSLHHDPAPDPPRSVALDHMGQQQPRRTVLTALATLGTEPTQPAPPRPATRAVANVDTVGFFVPPPLRHPPDATPALCALLGRFSSYVGSTSSDRICDNTAATYSTAQRAFIEFAAANGITLADIDDASPTNIGNLVTCFAAWLRTHRGVRATVVDSYLSGLITALTIAGRPQAEHLRSPTVQTLMKGLKQQDAKAGEARHRLTIPAYWSFMQRAVDRAATFFHPAELLEGQALLMLAYATGLRATEAASGGAPSDADHHHVRAADVGFKFAGDDAFHLLTDHATTTRLHGTRPTAVAFLLRHTKTIGAGLHTTRRGEQWRIAYANTTPGASPTHCPVRTTTAYVLDAATRRPWTRTHNLFNMSADRASALLKDVAVAERLDPARVSMRSLRPGSTCMLDGMATIVADAANAADIRDHGGWAGPTGERVYQDRLRDEGKALALYTTGPYTLEHLRFYYMPRDDDVPTVTGKRKRESLKQRHLAGFATGSQGI